MRFDFYRDRNNEYRWTLVSTTGTEKKVANQGEGLHNFRDMLTVLKNIFKDSPTRLKELDKALKTWEKENTPLTRSFVFYKEPEEK